MANPLPAFITPPKPALPAFNSGIKPATNQSNLYGLQGAPNSGKTTGAASFPNPLFLDFDKKLPPGVPCVEFWNHDYVQSICKNAIRANTRDALKIWLRAMKSQLTADQTLVIDSFSRVSDAFDFMAEADPTPYLSKKGEIDGFEVFRQKLLYFKTIFELLGTLPCRVVVTFHEQIERNEAGVPTGKLRPLVTGQFSDQAAGFFSNFYRCNCKEVAGKLVYTWQIRSNNLFNAVRGPEYDFPADMIDMVVEPNKGWQTLQQYTKRV
jgi:hypothetical protein